MKYPFTSHVRPYFWGVCVSLIAWGFTWPAALDGTGGNNPPAQMEVAVEVQFGRRNMNCTGAGICYIQGSSRPQLAASGKIGITPNGSSHLIVTMTITRISREMEEFQFYRDGRLLPSFSLDEAVETELVINGKKVKAVMRSGAYKLSQIRGGYLLSR